MAQAAVPLPRRITVKDTCCPPEGCTGNGCSDQQSGTELVPRVSNLQSIGSRNDAEPVCEATALLREKCCKGDTKPERQLVSGDVIRDLIIGLSDGLMVPFALTAGLSSLGTSKLVYQGGLAELVAGAISMGVGGFLSAQSEQSIYRYRDRMLARKWHDACPSEIARKVQELLAPYGVSETTCALVGHDLASGKSDSSEESTGIAAFTINVEEGLTEIPTKRLVMSALTIGLSYFIGGLIPIIPYFCTPDALKGLYWSILSTGIVLILFGIAKSWFTGAATSAKGLAWGAFSTLAVGGAAAAASYGIVRALELAP